MPTQESGVHIRRARAADAALLHAFICELAAYEREPDAVLVDPRTLAAQLASERPPFECLVAERGAQPAGFALFFGTYSTWLGRPGLHLEDLWVRPAHRGQGVARALLEHLAALAVQRGYGRLEWAVLDWNELAHGFYRRLGARPMDEWTTWRLDGAELEQLAQTPAPPAAQ